MLRALPGLEPADALGGPFSRCAAAVAAIGACEVYGGDRAIKANLVRAALTEEAIYWHCRATRLSAGPERAAALGVRDTLVTLARAYPSFREDLLESLPPKEHLFVRYLW